MSFGAARSPLPTVDSSSVDSRPCASPSRFIDVTVDGPDVPAPYIWCEPMPP